MKIKPFAPRVLKIQKRSKVYKYLNFPISLKYYIDVKAIVEYLKYYSKKLSYGY